MPDQATARPENSREFRDYPGVVRWMREESERSEKIEHGLEPVFPAGRQSPHVAATVAEIGTGSTISRDLEQGPGVIEPVDIVTRFGKQV